MILVDTSVWVDHLRKGNHQLADLLNETQVLGHPYISGELACGNLANRREILRIHARLPSATLASPDEALFFIEEHRLMGCGLGYIDVHLLASTALMGSVKLWTADKRLNQQATRLGMSYRH